MNSRNPDWHPADIIAALRKQGTTLAAVSRKAGLSSSTLANALSRPWPKGEWLIAEAIGVHPRRSGQAAITIRTAIACWIARRASNRERGAKKPPEQRPAAFIG